MPVIKQGDAARLTGGAIVLDLGDLNRQAEEILSQARREAALIVSEGETEAGRLVDAADARGYAQGRERGEREGREQGREDGRAEASVARSDELATLTAAWSDALERWDEDRATMLLSAREDVLRFALAMARKIVVRLPRIDPAVVQRQLAETLDLLAAPSTLRIHVNPEDRRLAAEALPGLVQRFGSTTHAELVDDPSMMRGGCTVRTAHGEIDATIEKQIDRIVKTLLPDTIALDGDDQESSSP